MSDRYKETDKTYASRIFYYVQMYFYKYINISQKGYCTQQIQRSIAHTYTYTLYLFRSKYTRKQIESLFESLVREDFHPNLFYVSVKVVSLLLLKRDRMIVSNRKQKNNHTAQAYEIRP